MAVLRPLHLVVLGAAVSFSMAFNIDIVGYKNYSGSGSREDFFGYKALQFKSEKEKGIIVSAPLQNNGTGGVFICNAIRPHCTSIPVPRTYSEANSGDSIRAFGMSVAIRAKSPFQFTACSPAWNHECDGTPYLNSICYQWDNSGLVSNITSGFKECAKQNVDLVFLFDGSLSMKTEDFKKNKEFIKGIMENLQNTSIQFAAVQFSLISKTVFTFKDYQEKKALKKLEDEPHMHNLTNTHGAMRFALNNLFDKRESGALPDATKAVVIITDGNPTDAARMNKISIIDTYNARHIKRFVIAVGGDVDMQKLRKLASDPNDTFSILNYAGLTGLLDKMQKKIFNIEGSDNTVGQTWEKELSQSGMSAEFIEDTLILGSVGSNNWTGSLYQIEQKDSREQEIQDPLMKNDSYMGYSVAVGKRKGFPFLYFTGAPRYEHQGQVIVFNKTTSDWAVMQRLPSKQIGSYFGAELCAIDTDSDGTTDFLIVGAPLYHQPQREGKLYVYAFTEENNLEEIQDVSELTQGRFASSIASLPDLDGDGQQDLAVGAPLEDDQRGAVYIYRGHKATGIYPTYSQHIKANMLSDGLQQFGITIDGKSDMDGLTEIAVGAYGQVVLLKARPVFSVTAHLSFSPSEIGIQHLICNDIKETFSVLNLTICFKMSEQTKSTTDALSTGLKLNYDLTVDFHRQNSRGFLAAKNTTLRRIQPSLLLNMSEMCQNQTIYMQNCVMDTLSPVEVKVNFSQAESQQSFKERGGILDIYKRREAMVKVPFEKACGHNDTCVAKLQMDFNFTSPNLVVYSDHDYLYVSVALSNVGDDSYNTSLNFHYPKGLSHSKLDVIKQNRRTLTSCKGDPDKNELTICSVNLPVFQSNNWAKFSESFYINPSLDWNDSIAVTIIAHSDNGSPKDYRVTKTLPVLFAVNLGVKFINTLGGSTTYIDYSLEDRGPKTLTHTYLVSNMGMVPLPVTVTFIFPTKPGNNFEIHNYSISNDKDSDTMVKCSAPTDLVGCFEMERCKMIKCNISTLERSKSLLFTLNVSASFNLSPNKYTFSEKRYKKDYITSAQISYDTTRYVQTGNGKNQVHGPMPNFHQVQGISRAEFIVPIHKSLIICLASGGGLLLLFIIFVALYKCGFFKRKKFAEEDEEQQADFDSKEMTQETQEAVVPSPEIKPLMHEESKTNGSFPVDDTTASPDSEETDAQGEQ